MHWLVDSWSAIHPCMAMKMGVTNNNTFKVWISCDNKYVGTVITCPFAVIIDNSYAAISHSYNYSLPIFTSVHTTEFVGY